MNTSSSSPPPFGRGGLAPLRSVYLERSPSANTLSLVRAWFFSCSCRRWKLMRKYVARKTSVLFDKYLQEKGASG